MNQYFRALVSLLVWMSGFSLVAKSQSLPPVSLPSCNSPASTGFCAALKSAIIAAHHKLDTAQKLSASPNDESLKADDATAEQDLDDAMHILYEPPSTDAFVTAAGSSFGQNITQSVTSPDSAFNAAVDAWEKQRLDVQQGSDPSSAGSTNLVVKSGVATLFAAAYQLGAFTQTVNGDTATFRANAGRFWKAIGHEPSGPSRPISPAGKNESIDSMHGKAKDKLSNHRFSADNLEFTVGVNPNSTKYSDGGYVWSSRFFHSDPGTIQLLSSSGSSLLFHYCFVMR